MTIFSIPKPFKDKHISIIQQNAIQSWRKLTKNVFLVGDDQGVAQIAKKLGVHHLPGVQRNEYGTPLLSSAFAMVRKKSPDETLVFTNADIIFLSDLSKIFRNLPKREFLVVGQRWDLPFDKLINFQKMDWESNLRHKIEQDGTRHPPVGSDYFVFSKKSFQNLPDFAVGRSAWDNWMIYESRRKRFVVIDASFCVTAIHQTHDYSFYKGPGKNIWSGPEAQKHYAILGDKKRVFDLSDSNYLLDKSGQLFHRSLPLVKWWHYISFTPEILPGGKVFWRVPSLVLRKSHMLYKTFSHAFNYVQEAAMIGSQNQ